MKRALSLILALLLTLCTLPALAEEPTVIVDEEEGLWRYNDGDLVISIDRFEEEKLVYYVADVQASPESPLGVCIPEGKKFGHKLVNPLVFAKEQGCVLAITDDFSGYRIQKDKTVGVVIRDGQVLSKKTYSSKKYRSWPNLDTLAVYSDGSMKANTSDAFTAEEYLENGAEQVFAFGPVLITDGAINPVILEPDYYPYSEPRLAIGMIEPYHYLIVCCVGRTDDSRGSHLDWLAQKMLELGAVEALNLDGGGTCAMMFMGKVLNRSSRNMRSINSLICFGRTDPME